MCLQITESQQTVDDAMTFYKGKQRDIGINLKDLEGILQSKANSLRIVEEGVH